MTLVELDVDGWRSRFNMKNTHTNSSISTTLKRSGILNSDPAQVQH